MEGYCKGDICNRDECNGIIDEHEKEGCCSCHINPPCGYCEEPNVFCEVCGWDAKEERDEADKIRIQVQKNNTEYYQKQMKEFSEARELFYKKFRGEMPAEKLEIRSESHTHFSMKKIGVFPVGTESRESVLPKVVGTFGGRFNMFGDYCFEYIAYTD